MSKDLEIIYVFFIRGLNKWILVYYYGDMVNGRMGCYVDFF